MKRLVPILVAAAIGGAAVAANGSVSASADDQVAADAAIAAFNERMTEAGGESSGPPDTTPVDPEEYADDNPGTRCFGEFATGLDPGGHIEGETARADADHFSMPGDEGTDEVDAGVIVLDDDHAEAARDFVVDLGSDDVATCLEDAFGALLEQADDSGTTLPDEAASIEVESESDLGVGDASAHVRVVTAFTYDGDVYTSTLDLYAATAGRSIAAITITTGEEPATDFDPVAELGALVDALS